MRHRKLSDWPDVTQPLVAEAGSDAGSQSVLLSTELQCETKLSVSKRSPCSVHVASRQVPYSHFPARLNVLALSQKEVSVRTWEHYKASG